VALESQKKGCNEKLESMELQISTVTADLAKLRGNDKDEELTSKLTQLNEEMDTKLGAAETKVEEFKAVFDKFQSETSEVQTQ
jgi:hypothetical protein